MRRLIETLQNIWKIDELKDRLIITMLFLLVYRLGSFVILPGINADALRAWQDSNVGTSNTLIDLLDMFSGGAFSNASIFALGIMPYISASIVIQLMSVAVPYFQRLQKEGESGRRKINQITRYLTVVVLILQGNAYLFSLFQRYPDSVFIMENRRMFFISSMIILTAGSMFIMWIGEKITDRGIGNGISLIIMIGIIARLPQSLIQEFVSKIAGEGLVMLVAEMVLLFIVFVLCILLVQGTRRIPVQYAKRIVGNRQYGGVRQYLPLKVNAAGVMPIIFAQAIMVLPMTILRYSTQSTGDDSFLRSLMLVFSDFRTWQYNALMFFLIVAFTYFYTAITINPVQIAEDMKKNGGFIPGVKPGKRTAEYIDTIMSRITFPGSIFLGIVAILPYFAAKAGVNQSFAQFYGGTSLLILVGVVLDTLQQIESYLLMRHYDGLMKSGRIKGKSPAGAAIY